jgi:hypothetical protein
LDADRTGGSDLVAWLPASLAGVLNNLDPSSQSLCLITLHIRWNVLPRLLGVPLLGHRWLIDAVFRDPHFYFGSHISRKMTPNKPDAMNPAMALPFAIEDHWRRVTDLERSA